MAARSKDQRSRSLDEIVAVYAPLGARQRRNRRLRLAALVASGVTIAATMTWLANTGISISERLGAVMLTAGNGAMHAASENFAAQSNALEAAVAALETRIANISEQNRALEEERAHYAAQGRELEALLASIEPGGAVASPGSGRDQQLDREIAAIAAQRKALEARWAQFEAQGELLATEIIAVNAQRRELEAQRRQIEQQRAALAELLEQASKLPRRNADVGDDDVAELLAAGDNDGFFHTSNSLTLEAGDLDEMRGGFTVGKGMDFSFGFEQTGAVNGVEQFQNTFSIDSVRSGFADVDMSNMQSVILQNGNGNYVSGAAIDALTNGFGNVIQNTLDDQVISTTTIYDISLHNMPGTMQGLSGAQALSNSLGAFR